MDTFSAGFDGSDYNSNKEVGDYARRLRPINRLAGNPTVLLATHPVKGADESNLVPFGGGALLNEVDANLTLWARGNTTTFHWFRKMRGQDFTPMVYRFDDASAPEVIDSKQRQLLVKILRPSSEEAIEQREDQEAASDRKLLEAIEQNPTGTQLEWGFAVGRSKAVVHKKLQRLCRQKLLQKVLDKYVITPTGRKALSA